MATLFTCFTCGREDSRSQKPQLQCLECHSIPKNNCNTNRISFRCCSASVGTRCHSTRCPLKPRRFTRGYLNNSMQIVIAASIFLHPGFVIIDHIHFQYNGFLFGISLWSILMARDVRYIYSFSSYAMTIRLSRAIISLLELFLQCS